MKLASIVEVDRLKSVGGTYDYTFKDPHANISMLPRAEGRVIVRRIVFSCTDILLLPLAAMAMKATTSDMF